MSPTPPRPLRVSPPHALHRLARRAGAIALGGALLAGCGGSSQPTPAYLDNVNTGPAALILEGQATFHGEPIANAAIRVVDARTDRQAASIVSAGSAGIVAVGSSQLIAVGSGNAVGPVAPLLTDAEGRFSLRVSGLGAGEAARVVVVAGTNALSTLVIGSATAPGRQYGVMQAPTGGLAINETTTTVAHLAGGVLKLSRLLRPEAAEPMLQELMTGLQRQMPTYERTFRDSPATGNRIAEDTDPVTGGPRRAQTGTVPGLVANTATRQAVFTLNKDALASIARGVADGASQAPDLPAVREQVKDVPLVGTGLTASVEPEAIELETPDGRTLELSLTDPQALHTTLGSTTMSRPY